MFKELRYYLFISLLMLAAILGAPATYAAPPKYSNDMGYMYVGFGGGYIFGVNDYQASLTTYRYTDVEDVFLTNVDSMQMYYDQNTGFDVVVSLGYDTGKNIVFELEGKFGSRSDYEITPGVRPERAHTLNLETKGFGINTMLYKDFGDNFVPYVGIGLGTTQYRARLTQNTETPVAIISFSDSQVVLNFMLGVMLPLAEQIVVYVRYNYAASEVGMRDGLLPAGTSRTDINPVPLTIASYDFSGINLDAHSVGFGMRFIF